jgi:hypothetical protein
MDKESRYGLQKNKGGGVSPSLQPAYAAEPISASGGRRVLRAVLAASVEFAISCKTFQICGDTYSATPSNPVLRIWKSGNAMLIEKALHASTVYVDVQIVPESSISNSLFSISFPFSENIPRGSVALGKEPALVQYGPTRRDFYARGTGTRRGMPKSYSRTTSERNSSTPSRIISKHR